MIISESYLSFWGKAHPAQNSTGPQWHPAAYHMLDVAAVFDALFPYYMSDEDAWLRPYLTFLVALHDIGKFTQSFQFQAASVPGAWPNADPPRTARHDTLGFHILAETFMKDFPRLTHKMKFFTLKPLIRAATGHHGKPPKEGTEFRPNSMKEFCPKCKSHASDLLNDFKNLLLVGFQCRDIDNNLSNLVANLSWIFAGMVNLADWIGSSTEWFPYHVPNMSVADYWTYAQGQATKAIHEVGLVPAHSADRTSFENLFGFSPSPVQAWCDTVGFPWGPKLFIIEDETGNGKTEAALTIAHRIISSGEATGFYCALPTMATANAMYDRCIKNYRKFFIGTASLALMHGRDWSNEVFCASILEGIGDIDDAKDPDDEPTGASCAAWIASDKRTRFLAEAGVGTIDQALLGVMPSKFAMLRLLGLSKHVLIIDEAHAYDNYMMEIIKKLIFFHSRMGGTTVVLSATLPMSMRKDIASAYADGCAGAKPNLISRGYPLATLISKDGALEEHDALMTGPKRKRAKDFAKVKIISSFSEAIDEIVSAAQDGQAVGWVRNTVKDAVAAFDILNKRGCDVVLFHSRFTVSDRAEIESRVLRLVGKDGDPALRTGKIIIATQVIEQSLDIDFDLMVSDLAPLDLLFQRVGREWRHTYHDRRNMTEARFIILSPVPVADPPENWLSGMDDDQLSLSTTKWVYGNISLLWRSVLIAQQVGTIGDITKTRCMIEAAYEEDDFKTYGKVFIPNGLQKATAAAENWDIRATNKGMCAPLKLDKDGYCGENFRDDVFVCTRLVKPTTTLRLARFENGRIVPWDESGKNQFRKWALSEVTLNRGGWEDLTYGEPDITQEVAETKKNWAKFDKRIPIIPLEDSGDGWFAAWIRVPDEGKSADYKVNYNKEYGLIVTKIS